jgi:CO dehydrogenase/acetyl-CoA synthase epsilon subunit
MTEDDKDRSWDCTKVLKDCEEKGLDGNTSYDCIVEWNDINKSQSRVNLFALNQRNHKCTLSFARKNDNPEKMSLSSHTILQI